MPEPAQEQIGELERLARTRFPAPPLTEAEVKLVRAAPSGVTAVCGPNPDSRDPRNDPSKAEGWGPERQIRADLIRWICADRQAKELVDPRGILVHGARIWGVLDLFGVTVPFPLTLAYCSLNSELNVRWADISGINLQGTWLDSIGGDGVHVKTNVFLRQGFHANGQVRLLGARIGGNIECDGSTFDNPTRPGALQSGVAFAADGAVVNGAVFMRNGFRAVGAVRLLGAQIGGRLDCSNSAFKNPFPDRAECNGIALYADSIRVKGGVFLNRGFHAEGQVSLPGAHIDGDFDCSDATLAKSVDGAALVADRTDVKGSVFLGGNFSAEGEVRLLGARVDGDITCDGGKFTALRGQAEDAIDRSLSAHTLTVKGNVFLRDGFHAKGEVGFTGAQIGGNIECTGGAFYGEINLQGATARGALLYRSILGPEHARLNLENATLSAIADDDKGWPEPGNLLLDGLVYERFSGGAPKDARRRLGWLDRQRSFAPQPYRQLAKVLREEGDDSGARKVLFEMERRRRAQGPSKWYQRLWSSALKQTVGYGYYPGNALRWLAGLTLLGMVLFWVGFCAGSITPADKDAYAAFKADRQLRSDYERFHASIYSIESSFPLVKLGQIDRWQADPSPQHLVKEIWHWPSSFVVWVSFAGFLRWFRWAEILLGWALATLFVAGVTGIVRKD